MIETITKRRKLSPRKTPYWQKVAASKYIGFYKTDEGGVWHARILINKKRYFQPIGGDVNSDFEDMLKNAQSWFEQAIKLNSPENAKQTIQNVVDDYIRYLEIEKSNDAAYRTEKQFEKHLLPTLAKMELKKLTTTQLKSWRDSLVKTDDDPETARKSKDSANRVLSMVKAAFNMAFRDGAVESDVAWKRVPPFKKVGASRDLFLTDNQVKILIDQATGGLRQLIQAGIYTGARAGELTTALTRDFDIKNGSLDVDGKTGKRTIYLSDAGIAFFKKITADKLPKALIFTHDDGVQWISNNYNRIFRKAVQEAKLPAETVFYSLRHYHISKALVAHIPAQIVSENCGTSIRMLETHYAKFMKKDRQSMMNKVELAI
jgi:integrase